MKVRCPYCAVEYEVDKSQYGQMAECGICGKSFILGQVSAGRKGAKFERPVLALFAYIVSFCLGLFCTFGGGEIWVNLDGEVEWCNVFWWLIGLVQLAAGCHLYVGHRRAKALSVVVVVMSILNFLFFETKGIGNFVLVILNAVPLMLCRYKVTSEWLSQFPSPSVSAWAAFVEKLKSMAWPLKIGWILIAVCTVCNTIHEDHTGWFDSSYSESERGMREYYVCNFSTYDNKVVRIRLDIRDSIVTILENREGDTFSERDFDVIGRFSLSSEVGRNDCTKVMRNKLRKKTFRQLVKEIKKQGY